MGGVICRQAQGLLPVQAPGHSADAGAGKNIPGAVEHSFHLLVGIIEKSILRPVVAQDARLAVAEVDAGQDADAGAEVRQAQQQGPGVGAVLPGAVGRARQECGFRDIGDDEVCLGAEAGHFLGKRVVKPGVEAAVVRHGGIDENQRLGALEVVDQLGDEVDLGEGAEVAGVDHVKPKALAAPMTGDGGDLIRQVLAGEAGEDGVGREDSRRQHRRFDAHGGDDRQGHRQGALPHAGDILHCQDPFHGFALLVESENFAAGYPLHFSTCLLY